MIWRLRELVLHLRARRHLCDIPGCPHWADGRIRWRHIVRWTCGEHMEAAVLEITREGDDHA